ncbi:hypothetical protein B0I35DRAFT_439817 [Stachybotrys elegans]|uniref:Uncharacterized protein n=1 Tax=Stachybotrys elegans TaxID=80388 RepID=A0A8K0WPE1_9HYPO|nr:hypothetical protein B0I35DRAFT_439817 [Stachybotrys elegans]
MLRRLTSVVQTDASLSSKVAQLERDRWMDQETWQAKLHLAERQMTALRAELEQSEVDKARVVAELNGLQTQVRQSELDKTCRGRA